MAGTVVEKWGKRTLELTYTGDGADWVCSEKISVKGIFFKPSAVADILKVHEDSLTGPTMLMVKSISGETVPAYFFGDYLVKPCIAIAECTFNVKTSIIISIDFGYRMGN